MNTMMSPLDKIASIAFLSLSSKSPLYLVPDSTEVMLSENTVLPRSISGTSPLTIAWASPSTIALLPTPGSPISTGLFLVRRQSISMILSISLLRPMMGSSMPCLAFSVKSSPRS